MALFELGRNLKVQEKLSNEIQKYFNENQELTYEAVANPDKMPYLNQVVKEVLRLHPIAPMLDRVCTKPDGYSLEPYGNFKIPHGMQVVIPAHALAHDEKFFKDPSTFDPDRYAGEKKYGAAFPFGAGARSCIGERFALIVVKTAIVKILKNFKIEMNEKTPRKLTINKRSFFLTYNDLITVDMVKK